MVRDHIAHFQYEKPGISVLILIQLDGEGSRICLLLCITLIEVLILVQLDGKGSDLTSEGQRFTLSLNPGSTGW